MHFPIFNDGKRGFENLLRYKEGSSINALEDDWSGEHVYDGSRSGGVIPPRPVGLGEAVEQTF